jgi:hypothetical protein
MKRILLCVMTLIISSCLFAADVKKPVVSVSEFSYSSVFGTAEVEVIRNAVIAAMNRSGLVALVDLHTQGQVNEEAERRKQETAMNDAGRVDEIQTLNSNYLLSGNLDGLTITSETYKTKDGGSKIYYQANFSYTLKLVNPATGTVAGNQTFEQTAAGSSENEARARVMSSVDESSINKYVQKCFPVKGSIIQIESGDKKAKSVYINLGSAYGMQKGQKFDVYSVFDIVGEKSEKLVGTITVKEVLSEGRSLCNVNDGGDVIADELKAGKILPIKSRSKKEFLGGLLKMQPY